ncbi:MAG: hypothetical protein ACI8ZV_000800, partial [Chitinophagales bacterium]
VFITAVPLTWNRHTGLDPLSSDSLNLPDFGPAKSAVWDDGSSIYFISY